MTPMRPLIIAALAASLWATAAIPAMASLQELFQEPTYQGKPITYWLQVIRDRNDSEISEAFEAIYSLGPDAWVAVPELTRFVGAPFKPIRVGKDSQQAIAAKLYEISLRAEAVQALSWIGELAAPATTALVRWALVQRVSLAASAGNDEREVFVELVAMDAEERMQTGRAISHFGRAIFPELSELLSSPDPGKRKLGVVIMGPNSLGVAAEMLHSKACEDRKLGLQIFRDMHLVVAQSHLEELVAHVQENCVALTKLTPSQ